MYKGAIFLATVSAASIAHAQVPRNTADDVASASEGGIEDIVVTAERRDQRLSKVPIAISAITAGQIEGAKGISTRDLEQLVPGLATNGIAVAGNYWLPYIRGVGSSSPLLGNNSSVATYIDGVYQPASSANIMELNNIERIEVVKGPQGTLFGRNATGGAINIVTKTPSKDFQLVGEGSYGRFNEVVGKFYLTGPLSQALTASLAYQYHGGGEYIRNVTTGGKFGGFNAHNVSGKLHWTPSDRFEATVHLIYNRRILSDPGIARAYDPAGGTPVPGQVGGPVNYNNRDFNGDVQTRYKTEGEQYQLHMRYSADAFDIVSITGYQHANDDIRTDYDASPARLFFFNQHTNIKAFSQELQLASTSSGPLKFLAGLFYSSDIQAYKPLTLASGLPFPGTVAQVAAAGAAGSRIDIQSESNASSYAAFGQATYEFAENTHLTLGIRYTEELRKIDGQLVLQLPNATATAFTPVAIVGPVKTSKRFKKPTWRVSLDHSFDDDLMVYASYNRGFKSGVYNLTAPTQAPVSPEVLDAFETGGKSKLLGGNLLLNASVFYYDYKNLQVNVTSAGVILDQNAASAEIYGLDLDGAVKVTPNWTVRGGVSLLHSKYKSYPNANTFLLVGGAGLNGVIDATGDTLIYAPKLSFNMSSDYSINLPGESSLLLSAAYSRSSRMKTTIGDNNFLRAYGMLNGSITWSAPDDRYLIGVYGRNLLNEERVGTYLNSFGLEKMLIRPRTYGVTVGFKFR